MSCARPGLDPAATRPMYLLADVVHARPTKVVESCFSSKLSTAEQSTIVDRKD